MGFISKISGIISANVCRGQMVLFILLSVHGIIYSADHKTVDTLAVIGKSVITSNSFLDAYRSKLRETGLNDNIEIRRKYLQNLVGDELLISESRRRGMDNTDDAKEEYERLRTQELLNAYTLKHVSPLVKVTEADLQRLFALLNSKVKVSHLYAPTKHKADSLYNELSQGQRFEKLAYDCFDDPQLKYGGGSLGYISIDEMDPDFEKAAFSMKPGEISKPVKTVQGYSIIRIEDVKSNPLLSENEYLKAHDKLARFARKRAFETASKEYAHSLSSNLNIEFNQKVIDKLYSVLRINQLDRLIEQPDLISESDLNETAVSSDLGNWSVQYLINQMSSTPDKQKNWIKTEENLRDFITGLVNRKYIVNQSFSEGLDKTDSFNKELDYKFDTYLLTCIEDELRSTLDISEDEINDHYKKYPQEFVTEADIRLSLILLDNKPVSDTIKAKLSAGSDFSELAKAYSIQSLTAVNGGDAGYFKQKDLEYLGEDIFRLDENEWAGPFEDKGKFVFIKCTDKKNPRLKPLDEVHDEIEKSLISLKWFDARRIFINELKNNGNVKVFPAKLNKLKL